MVSGFTTFIFELIEALCNDKRSNLILIASLWVIGIVSNGITWWFPYIQGETKKQELAV